MGEPINPGAAPAQQKHQILISYDGTNVSFQGPIDNQMLCFAMLEMAKQIVASANAGKITAIKTEPEQSPPPPQPDKLSIVRKGIKFGVVEP